MTRTLSGIAAIVLLSLPALAMDPAQAKPQSFDAVRREHLQRLDAKLKRLENRRSCVAKASNNDQIKACNPRAKSESKAESKSQSKPKH